MASALVLAVTLLSFLAAATAQTCDGRLKVEAGDAHLCLIKADNGNAQCWGRNYFGEATAPSGATFTQIGTGAVHTCGIRTDKTIACWGYNGANETLAPSGVFSDLTVGSRHACAIRDTLDKDIVCWGLSEDNRLAAPTGKFRQVAAGAAHTCAISDTDGHVECWGYYTDKPAATTYFSSITAGFAHSCGVKVDGNAECWPTGLADGRATVPSTLGTVTSISTHGSHTCAVKTSGNLICWGTDSHSESSGFTTTDLFEYATTGWYYTCAVRKADKIVVCWGENTHGRATPPSNFPVCSTTA